MNNEVVIYYRKSLMDKDELLAARKYIRCVDLLAHIPKYYCDNNCSDINNCHCDNACCFPPKLTIGRFSLFPFYTDQEAEINSAGSKLINTYEQHRYVADLQNYVLDLCDMTPLTWDNIIDVPDDIPLIVKGESNSKKNDWSKSMFAANKKEAIKVIGRLYDDSLISQQKLYIRQYVPLVKYMDGINGMPVSKEFRVFVCYGKIVSSAFYWQNYIDDIGFIPSANDIPEEFIQKAINRIGNKCNFYTIDVAETQSGEWIVIELNDGQFAGLSCHDPNEFYRNLLSIVS
jgi:hypothetical protein